MKKLEIIEYGLPSKIDLNNGKYIFLGNIIHAGNIKDHFDVYKNNIDFEKETPRDLELGTWEHFKGGRYKVYGFAYREKTNETMVIYQSLYSSNEYPKGTFWGRPIDDFLGYKEKDEKKIKRFVFVE